MHVIQPMQSRFDGFCHNQSRNWSVILLGVLVVVTVSANHSGGSQESGSFVHSIALSNVEKALDLVFISDDRVLIVGKKCKICISVLTEVPRYCSEYLSIPDCNNRAERGLLGLEIDPEFAVGRPFVYVYFTATVAPFGRVVRYRHIENTGFRTSHADLASSLVLWSDSGRANECCHYGGGLAFGPGGFIYVGTGDKMNASSSQDPVSPNGKIHRFGKDGDPSDIMNNWASGLRNPFKISYDNVTRSLWVADVGGNDASTAWEAVYQIQSPGHNFGWPLCEGPCTVQQSPSCKCRDGTHTEATFAYAHHGGSAAIIGGVVYRPNAARGFPADEYDGKYFFGDFSRRRLYFIDATNPTNSGGKLDTFESTGGQPVALRQGPDGGLYYITWDGHIHHISYHTENYPPVVTSFITNHSGASTLIPIAVHFSTTVVAAPVEKLVFSWQFGDGTVTVSETSSVIHTYRESGRFSAHVTISTSSHSIRSRDVTVDVGHRLIPHIREPVRGSTFQADSTVSMLGMVQVDDGFDVPPADLTYRWEVLIKHDDHFHPIMNHHIGQRASFVVDGWGHSFAGDVSLIVRLSVEDSLGYAWSDTDEIELFPQMAEIEFDSIPASMTAFINGIPKSLPYTMDALAGSTLNLNANERECDQGLKFDYWQTWKNATVLNTSEISITVPTEGHGFGSEPATVNLYYQAAKDTDCITTSAPPCTLTEDISVASIVCVPCFTRFDMMTLCGNDAERGLEFDCEDQVFTDEMCAHHCPNVQNFYISICVPHDDFCSSSASDCHKTAEQTLYPSVSPTAATFGLSPTPIKQSTVESLISEIVGNNSTSQATLERLRSLVTTPATDSISIGTPSREYTSVPSSLPILTESTSTSHRIGSIHSTSVYPTVAPSHSLWQCSFENGVDYAGNDIENGRIELSTAEDCADACRLRKHECSFFTLAWGFCYLKSSDVGRKIQSQAISGRCFTVSVSEASTESTRLTCNLHEGIDYNGNDIDDGLHKAETVDECSLFCLSDRRCSHFTYQKHRNRCYLKDDKGQVRQRLNSIAGECLGASTTERTETTTAEHNEQGTTAKSDIPNPTSKGLATTSADTSASTSIIATPDIEQCILFQDRGIIGSNLEDGKISDVTLHLCSQHCTSTPKCTHFTYTAETGRCRLKNSAKRSEVAPGKVSGDCTAGTTSTTLSAEIARTCRIEEDTVYSGYDLEDGTRKAKNVAACAQHCISSRECTYFSFIPEKNKCMLKYSDKGKKSRIGKLGGDCSMVEVESSSKPSCTMYHNMGISGYNLIGARHKVEDANECALKCTTNSGCTSFTFNPNTLTCTLKAGGVMTESEAKISGQCTSLNLGIPSSTCVLVDEVDFKGHDLSDGKKELETEQECMEFCVNTPECSHFTFIPKKMRCLLKSSGDGNRTKAGRISGICNTAFPNRHRRMINPTTNLSTKTRKTRFFPWFIIGMVGLSFIVVLGRSRSRTQTTSNELVEVAEPRPSVTTPTAAYA